MKSTMTAHVLGVSLTKPNDKGQQYMSVMIGEAALPSDSYAKGLRIIKVSADPSLFNSLNPDPSVHQTLEFENRLTKDKYGSDSIKPYMTGVNTPAKAK